jgi:hypothetical protein
MLSYEDVDAAADFVIAAFGFSQRGDRLRDADGRVTHVELIRDDAVVMLGWPGTDYRDPRRHARGCADAARWLASPFVVDGVLVTVDTSTRITLRRRRAAPRSSAGSRMRRPAGSTRRRTRPDIGGCFSSRPRRSSIAA